MMTTHPEHDPIIAVVERTANERRHAIAAYHDAIIQAQADGHPYRRIADAAGTDVSTIHRIVKRRTASV